MSKGLRYFFYFLNYLQVLPPTTEHFKSSSPGALPEIADSELNVKKKKITGLVYKYKQKRQYPLNAENRSDAKSQMNTSF